MIQGHTYNRIAVIGAGLSGVCTAYFLAQAGFDVTVLECRNNIAEEATLGNSGLLAPSAIHPLSMPGMIRTSFNSFFQAEPAILLNSSLSLAYWRWLRASRREFQLARIRNKQLLTRITEYGQGLTYQLQTHYELEHENTYGLLHLFRTQADAAKIHRNNMSAEYTSNDAASPDKDHPARSASINIADIMNIEPAFTSAITLAGAAYYPQDSAGNCVLFVKQLKAIAQSLNVQFHFSQKVDAIRPETDGQVTVTIGPVALRYDAVVLATGAQSKTLLKSLGITLPLYQAQHYSGIVAVKNPDAAPTTSIVDETAKVTLTRTGNRLRLNGLLGFLPRTKKLHSKAIRSLLKVANDYFPNAANFNYANFWSNTIALTPSGLPLLGATPLPHIYINTGHGGGNWASEVGSAALLAEMIAGQASTSDIKDLLLTAPWQNQNA